MRSSSTWTRSDLYLGCNIACRDRVLGFCTNDNCILVPLHCLSVDERYSDLPSLANARAPCSSHSCFETQNDSRSFMMSACAKTWSSQLYVKAKSHMTHEYCTPKEDPVRPNVEDQHKLVICNPNAHMFPPRRIFYLELEFLNRQKNQEKP